MDWKMAGSKKKCLSKNELFMPVNQAQEFFKFIHSEVLFLQFFVFKHSFIVWYWFKICQRRVWIGLHSSHQWNYCICTTIIIPAKIDWFPNQLKLNPSWWCQFFSNSENSYCTVVGAILKGAVKYLHNIIINQ